MALIGFFKIYLLEFCPSTPTQNLQCCGLGFWGAVEMHYRVILFSHSWDLLPLARVWGGLVGLYWVHLGYVEGSGAPFPGVCPSRGWSWWTLNLINLVQRLTCCVSC